MRKTITLALIIAATLFCHSAQAQEEDPPTDSLVVVSDSFEHLATQILTTSLEMSPDSAIQARITKLHGRWYNFWKTKVCLDAPDSVSMFAPAAMAHQYMITPVTGPGVDDGGVVAEPPTWPPKSSTHQVCLDGVNGGNWQFIGPKYDHYNKTRG